MRSPRRTKRTRRRAVAALGSAALVMALAACSSAGTARLDTTGVPATTASTTPSSVATAVGLTEAEQSGLVWMREEEKLAHDVYQVLGDLWGVRTFANITSSESIHMGAVKTLLDRYGIADPAAGRAVGEFTDPAMQALYDELVAQGRRSLMDALEVGAAIEELDIADLQARATATPDIAAVYADLEKGSRNHLRAFTGQLGSLGETYLPVHISQSAFDAIVGSAIERGPEG